MLFTTRPTVKHLLSTPVAQSFRQEIWVFRSDIRTKSDAVRVCKKLMEHGLILRSTIDTADCDHVLRVVGIGIQAKTIIQIVHQLGHTAEELP